jgi:hypothetical protein
MNILKFKTIVERTVEVSFVENNFFDWMMINGYPNLKIENQMCLFLNNMHQPLLNVQGESVISISYIFSDEFRKRYSFINDTLLYRL